VLCVSVFLCLYTGRGLATSWSPAQGFIPAVFNLGNWSETESFMEVGQGPNWGCSAKGKKSYAFGFLLLILYTSSLRAHTQAREASALLVKWSDTAPQKFASRLCYLRHWLHTDRQLGCNAE
jgi:hypothetical protein